MRTVRHAEAVGSRKHRYDFWKIDRRPYGLVNTLEHRFVTSAAASSTSGKIKSSTLTACPFFAMTFLSIDEFLSNNDILRNTGYVRSSILRPPVIECLTRGGVSYCKIFARERENCFTTTASIDATSIKHDYPTHLNVTHGHRVLSSSFFFFSFFFK